MRRKETITIRRWRPADIREIAHLSGELGYPSSASDIKNRLHSLAGTARDAIFVAHGKVVTGWIHVAVVHTLESGTYAEIRGLVVAELFRGSGIGSQLVRRAEKWASAKKVKTIRVRTNIKRKRTRVFYNTLGYRVTKRQEVFEKKLRKFSNQ